MLTVPWILVLAMAAGGQVSAKVDQVCGRQELTEARPCPDASSEDCCCEIGSTGIPELMQMCPGPSGEDVDCSCYLDRCSFFDPADRIDCGLPGITPEQCRNNGCCYSEVPLFGFNYCWYPACTKTNMDVCFLVDTSGSISQSVLDNVRGLVVAVTDRLTLGDDAIRTCIIDFDTNPVVSVPLDGNNPLIVPGFNSGGQTQVQAALDLMESEFLARGLEGNCQVGVVLSDGAFGTGLVPPPGVNIITVGVTLNSQNFETMLKELASGSFLSNVLISQTSGGFDLVTDEFISQLRHLTCCPDPEPKV